MHRSSAAVFCSIAMGIAACGGRIEQGEHENFDAGAVAPSNDPTRTVTTCGAETCGAHEECCVGGSRVPDEDDATTPLETCVAGGTCDTGLLLDCLGDCVADSVCCLTINPTTSFATAGCAASCGGNGAPAVQLCESDAQCPTGSKCFTASMGPNARAETIDICGGIR